MSGERDRRSGADWAALGYSLFSKVLPYAFWFCLVFFGLPRLEPLLELIAGRETVFQFDAALNVSLVVNGVLATALAKQVRAGRASADQVKELEGGRPPLTPQSEELPLDEDQDGK